MESGRGVGQSEEHNAWLEQAPVRDESSFPFVSLADSDIVIAPAQVDLRENLSAPGLVEQLVDEGEGVSISLGDLVQVAVVVTEPEFPVLLLNKEDQVGPRGC